MNLTGNIYRTNPNSGGTGTTDYRDLKNLPTINGVILSGELTADDLNIVQKEEGKTLTSNNFTDELKQKVEASIDGIFVDGTKTTEITLPKKTSELTNDSGFQTEQQVTEVLKGYATKEQIPDISNLATKQELPDVSGFVLKEDVPDISEKIDRSELSNYIQKTTYDSDKQTTDQKITTLEQKINGLVDGDEVAF